MNITEQLEIIARASYRALDRLLPPVGKSLLRKAKPLGSNIVSRLKKKRPVDFQLIHTTTANSIIGVEGKKVLVVGCNTGKECNLFIRLGAAQADGLDVIEEIGRDFPNPRTTYIKCSAEEMTIPNDTYDLVYSLATFEHIPNIAPAFKEMARVTKPGGYVYCVAAPLWNSRWGHHKKNIFESAPWIHLLHTKEEIFEYCAREGLSEFDGLPMSHHINYMLNPTYFNMRNSSEYIDACNSIEKMKTIRNELLLEPDSVLPDDIYSLLQKKGFSRQELLATTHIYVGQKME